jgi:hypothetical protein
MMQLGVFTCSALELAPLPQTQKLAGMISVPPSEMKSEVVTLL